ncbi:hypothetical protein PsYK624_103040 [Phanerochaete sordida]|uniref:Uncharacterized protein n=1 Tax=Phanerochaete sordida TaxID=48140 RepID=A0A9P3LG26_9APHY|nr:hypothetical protein PsYK624_103040 [Phanerochaete sordida]
MPHALRKLKKVALAIRGALGLAAAPPPSLPTVVVSDATPGPSTSAATSTPDTQISRLSSSAESSSANTSGSSVPHLRERATKSGPRIEDATAKLVWSGRRGLGDVRMVHRMLHAIFPTQVAVRILKSAGYYCAEASVKAHGRDASKTGSEPLLYIRLNAPQQRCLARVTFQLVGYGHVQALALDNVKSREPWTLYELTTDGFTRALWKHRHHTGTSIYDGTIRRCTTRVVWDKESEELQSIVEGAGEVAVLAHDRNSDDVYHRNQDEVTIKLSFYPTETDPVKFQIQNLEHAQVYVRR